MIAFTRQNTRLGPWLHSEDANAQTHLVRHLGPSTTPPERRGQFAAGLCEMVWLVWCPELLISPAAVAPALGDAAAADACSAQSVAAAGDGRCGRRWARLVAPTLEMLFGGDARIRALRSLSARSCVPHWWQAVGPTRRHSPARRCVLFFLTLRKSVPQQARGVSK